MKELTIKLLEVLVNYHKDRNRKRYQKEEQFFRNHVHEIVILRNYDSIDKIIVFNDSNALFDFDARRLRQGILESTVGKDFRRKDSYMTFENLMYGLDYLIDSDKRWMFAHDIPPSKDHLAKWPDFDQAKLKEVELELNNERWLLSSDPFRFLKENSLREFYELFYRSLCRSKVYYTEQMMNSFLGFYCKRCDSHYNPSELRMKWTLKSPPGCIFGVLDLVKHIIVPYPTKVECCPKHHEV